MAQVAGSNPFQKFVCGRIADAPAGHYSGNGPDRVRDSLQVVQYNLRRLGNRSLEGLHEKLKDALDPNGVWSAGRYGIWPKQLRNV